MSRPKVRNTGEWRPIIDWLDLIAGGAYRIPVFSKPPITRNPDGSLNVTNKKTTVRCEVGDWIILIDGEFFVIPENSGFHSPNSERVNS